MTDFFLSDDVLDVRDLTGRVDELEALRTPRYVAGWNMPGYMPDNPPEVFEDADSAREYLADEMDRVADDEEFRDEGDQELVAQLRAAAQALRDADDEATDPEYGNTVGHYHYFISYEGVAFSDEDDAQEYDELVGLLQALAGNGGDHQWRGDWYPGTLIRDSHFTDYAQQQVSDIGDLPDTLPSYLEIDWQATARNIRMDYYSVEIGGETYWYR